MINEPGERSQVEINELVKFTENVFKNVQLDKLLT